MTGEHYVFSLKKSNSFENLNQTTWLTSASVAKSGKFLMWRTFDGGAFSSLIYKAIHSII